MEADIHFYTPREAEHSLSSDPNPKLILRPSINLGGYLTSGTIIADNVNNWNKLIIVNQGLNDGVEVGMTVVSEKGLVGYVKEVSDSTSKVLCLTDVGNSISCRLSKTKEAVVCKGELSLENESKLKLKYIPTDVELAVGDIVETSGIGGIYKKGITVGEIVEMHNSDNKLESYAIVKTAVDFSKLEYVLIVVE